MSAMLTREQHRALCNAQQFPMMAPGPKHPAANLDFYPGTGPLITKLSEISTTSDGMVPVPKPLKRWASAWKVPKDAPASL